jgi:hypothetical protein
MGTVFEGYFKIVSLKTLALLFTMAWSGNSFSIWIFIWGSSQVWAALSKWATGEHIKLKKFSEEDHWRYYEAYLEDLTKWDGMNPIVSLNIWKWLGWKLIITSGIEVVGNHPMRLRRTFLVILKMSFALRWQHVLV